MVLTADEISLLDTTQLNATGATGGGFVLVGGDWQGGGPMHQATSVFFSADSQIDASATDFGDGGEVVLWSDVHKAGSVTTAHGSIWAKGGVNGGNGGRVETSGHELQLGEQVFVSTQAPKGLDGEWLLDPEHLWIRDPSWNGYNYSTSGTTTYTALTANPAANFIVSGATDTRDRGPTVDGVFYPGVTVIRTDTINTALSNGNVRVVATGLIEAMGWGLSEVNNPNHFINSTTSNKLTLQAGTSITLGSYKFNLPNGSFELLAGTMITQNGPTTAGAIHANTLILGSTDGGTNKPAVTLTAATNYITNLQASNISSLSLSNAQALTVNSNGLNVSGAVSLSVTGDLTVNGAISLAGTSSLISSNDILVNANVTKSSGADATLTVKSARHLSFSTNTSLTSTSGKLNMVLQADSDKSGDGFIKYSGPSINTNGGSLQFGIGDTAVLNGATAYVGGDVYFDGTTAQTVSTGGGAISIYGETLVANTSGLTLNSDAGAIRFYGVVNSASQVFTGVNHGSGISWITALDLADNAANSFLASISSRLENSMAALSVIYNTAWIGGRSNSSGVWRWEAGPLAGQAITYTNWASGEPNNCCTNIANGNGFFGENAMQFTGSNGNWNDLFDNAGAGSTLNWYVRATTLNSSPLTVSSTANVTFDKAVGVNKTLSNLSVTGNQVTFSDALKLDSTGATITNAGASSVAGSITGTGALNKNGAGSLILSGYNTYTGATNINAGSLLVGSGGTSGSLGTGLVTNNSALVFNRSDLLTVLANITGAGTLTKLGADRKSVV